MSKQFISKGIGAGNLPLDLHSSCGYITQGFPKKREPTVSTTSNHFSNHYYSTYNLSIHNVILLKDTVDRFRVCKSDKAESSGFSSHGIHHDDAFINGPKLFKMASKRLFTRVPLQSTDKQLATCVLDINS